MSLTITHTYTCDLCGATKDKTQWFDPKVAKLDYPYPPIGWQIIDQKFVCPEHEVTIRIPPKQECKGHRAPYTPI